MRNLKRALSLTLASVMLLGMMVVGSSAAVGYDDVAETDNVEAIEVLQEIEIMVGDERGFGPERPVTRAEMAVVMGKLLSLDYNYYVSACPFDDVYDWARGYVGACYARHIVSGRGDGVYDPGATVTAVEAASMLMRALGYFQYPGDVADGFEVSTVRQGTMIGIFNGVGSSATEPMTRNQVAQMVLNALQSDMVTFTGTPGVEYTGTSGESWTGGYRAEYTPRTSTDPKYNRLIDNKHSSNIDYSGQYYVQLGEELFNGDLVKRADSDIFERPSFTWTYKTEMIGTYVDKEKLQATYTTGVEGRTLYDLLNSVTIRDYDLEVYVDGHEAGKGTNYNTTGESYTANNEVFTSGDLRRSNTNNLGITGDGVLTEVYLDRDKELITVTSIHTWLAQATSSYNTTRNTAGLKVFTSLGNSGVISASKTVNIEDVPEVEDVIADTFYLVRMSDKDTTDLEIVDIEEPTILAESTVTKFSNGRKDNLVSNTDYPTSLTVDGSSYNDSDRSFYDADTLNQYDADLLTTNTYNVYLDKYGYFIGIDLFEGNKQYVFITGYDMRNSNLSIQTAQAAGIFLDGTMDTITVNVKDTNKNIKSMVTDKTTSNSEATAVQLANSQAYYRQWGAAVSQGVYLLNRWYTYTESNGVYTLKPCVNKDGVAMMLAAKTQDTGSEDDTTLKLNCASLRLDSVTDTWYTDATHYNSVGDLLIGETMQYTTGTGTGAGQVLTSVRAYGEDASVFITVDVDEVSATAGGETVDGKLDITKAITDVNGVYTGVQDVDIITTTADRIQGMYYANNTDSGSAVGGVATVANDTWSTSDENGHWIGSGANTYLAENAYAVFDKNNFIIGAVILGEAEGSTATKAYILDPVKYERIENGTYYWQFEAVIDGEIVTQEARSKFSSTIDTMRNNQYEVVELRYNDDGVVTDVKKLDRIDSTASNSPADKIYGNPFAEIGYRRVDDKESVYDVVLTGVNGAEYDKDSSSAVGFNYVTRPRSNNVGDSTETIPGHLTAGKSFTETQLGILRLQGRTLWLLDGQADYAIDFVTGAKAVVRQPVNGEMKTVAYASVEEAVNNLGDVLPGTEAKEFRGIITAVLNSRGVAEWVVFYSDTNVETLNDSNVGQAYIEVDVWVELPGASAAYRETVKVYRPTDGTDIATIPAPVIAGYTAEEPSISIVWSKNYSGHVTFQYARTVDAPVVPEETMTVTINMLLKDKDGKFEATLNGGTRTITRTEAGAINAPEVTGYTPDKAQDSVPFVAGSNGVVTFTYTALSDGEQQPTPPGEVGGDHPTDPGFGDEYEDAGITVTETVSENGSITFTMTGKNSDIITYLTENPGTTTTNVIDGTTYMFVGFYFDSPTDKDGHKAASAKMYRDGTDLGIGIDGEGRLFQWIAVARQEADGTWVAHKVSQKQYKNEWTMADGSVIEQFWTCVNAIEP